MLFISSVKFPQLVELTFLQQVESCISSGLNS